MAEKPETTLEEKIDKAIEDVLGKVRTNMTPDEALKLSQAVLNMAHAKLQLLGPPSKK